MTVQGEDTPALLDSLREVRSAEYSNIYYKTLVYNVNICPGCYLF